MADINVDGAATDTGSLDDINKAVKELHLTLAESNYKGRQIKEPAKETNSASKA